LCQDPDAIIGSMVEVEVDAEVETNHKVEVDAVHPIKKTQQTLQTN
jgi:hypothetical protein